METSTLDKYILKECFAINLKGIDLIKIIHRNI